MKNNLLRAIERGEQAYRLYLENRKYFQALRIYKANQETYRLLNEFIYSCDEDILNDVITYLFHLEDWFHQFELSNTTCELDSMFVFERFEHSLAFPQHFKKLLLS